MHVNRCGCVFIKVKYGIFPGASNILKGLWNIYEVLNMWASVTNILSAEV